MAKFARVENGHVVEWQDTLPINWDNVNGFFKLPPEITIKYGWYPVIVDEPKNFDTNRYFLGNRRGIVNETFVIEKFDLIARPDSETNRNLEAAEHAFFVHLREVRDQLLAATDWTQLADSPVDGAAWAEYRQKLRDLPKECLFVQDLQLKMLLPPPPMMLKNIVRFY